jgi:uncharacterized membrane protein YozB (DUF420 family)
METLLAEPGFLAPSGTIGADVSYILAVVFTVLFLIAWGMAKKAQGTRHHKLILVSMVSMIVYFVGYYYARSLGVLSFEGREGFGGPDDVYENVYSCIKHSSCSSGARVDLCLLHAFARIQSQ